MNVVFNPEYVLKPDAGAVLLLPKESVIQSDSMSDSNFFMRIHSIHAAILSFFDGRDTEEAVNSASSFLNVSPQFIHSFIEKLKNNQERVGVAFKGVLVQFPKKCLIETEGLRIEKNHPNDFDYTTTRLGLRRHKTPTDITLMITTKCATDCIYCYADRRNIIDCKIPLDRIKEIIQEAKSLNVRGFDVIGGEFFLYRYWRELLQYLGKYNYQPFMSTKVPIRLDSIQSLKEIGIKGLQVSLDTLHPQSAISLYGVKANYVQRIKKTLKLLDQYDIKIFLHTIVTAKNDNPSQIKAIYEFIKDLKNVDSWRLDLPGASLYKKRGNFETHVRPRVENLEKIKDCINSIRNEKPYFSINYNLTLPLSGEKTDKGQQESANQFCERAICSANFSSLFILPDGQVTGCEELYWNKRFILGNIMEQSLKEIWDSPRAYDLHYIRRSEIPVDSPCWHCSDFYDCRLGQGICYRDVIKSFGEEKWYYPDKNCPKAPKPIYAVS